MYTIFTGQKTSRRLKDGAVEYLTYMVEVDPKQINNMAMKAASSKGAKCKDGALLVTITAARTEGK